MSITDHRIKQVRALILWAILTEIRLDPRNPSHGHLPDRSISSTNRSFRVGSFPGANFPYSRVYHSLQSFLPKGNRQPLTQSLSKENLVLDSLRLPGSPLANKGSQNRSKSIHPRYTHSRQLLPFLYLTLSHSNIQPIVITIVDRRDSQEFGTAVGHEVDNRPTFFLGFGSGNAPEKERDSANGPSDQIHCSAHCGISILQG
ncbi:hypothetical protein QR685DRAFT_113559 [Neurospora intermedia]|uniref:Uncharacterized protein n=1 Tax=Neurospora intermedia TaxID=5142 RepID=A0ABR3CZU6_NEUIN